LLREIPGGALVSPIAYPFQISFMDSASLDPLSDGDLTWLRASGTRGRKSHGS
jgi:hypothetical protein